ncbi:hypothetical protein [Halobacillus salinus]|nr:hypothetical protein [Halobacillus salinus]
MITGGNGMGVALMVVIFFLVIGVGRVLLGIASSRSKSDRYDERDYS